MKKSIEKDKPYIHYCPKCKARVVVLREFMETVLEYNVSENGVIDEGTQNPGLATGVWAICDNGHMWRLRGIIQVN